MSEHAHLTAAEIRERVGHPIVDGDGHFMEFMPLVDDEIVTYLEEAGGATLRVGRRAARYPAPAVLR